METIVVTTDLTTDSKSAIRFAISLARSRKAKLTVLHVYHHLKPFIWLDSEFEVFTQTFLKKTTLELDLFLRQISSAMKHSDFEFDLKFISNINVTDGILKFTKENPCDYICISTRGANTLTKIFGTHTSKLITQSKIPVIGVPSSYRQQPFKRILYAADMKNYEAELPDVLDFVRPFNAEITMLHIASNNESVIDKTAMEASILENFEYEVKVISKDWNISNTVLHEVEKEAAHYRPSVIAFFTHHPQYLLDKLLFPLNAVEFSFSGKIPFISFYRIS